MLTFLAAVTLAAAPAPNAASTQPALTAPQASALRCGVVFALGAKLQAERDPVAADWPPLGARGKEFFVRVTAQLMDDTGASREALAALAMRELPALQAKGAMATAMPGCLPLLTASGL
jgi:hypothetical protein